MQKKLHIALLLLLFAGSFSCSRFEEYNTDPDRAAEVSPKLLATHLILQTVTYPHIGKDFLYKDMISKYISYMEGATSYQYNKIERTDFGPFIDLTNVKKMTEAASGTIYENSYTALGKFIRAYTFFDLTLRVGDIPYSEAVLGEYGLFNPKYDTQKDVFTGILNELDEAAGLFAAGINFPGDPVFGGDVVKWQKASNNLSLKILTYLWKHTDDPGLNVVERFNAIVTAGPLMESEEDNFQLVYSDLEVEHYPFYNSNFRLYPIMSTTIVDRMKELQDPRLFYYAEPSGKKITEGLQAEEWDAYVGVDPSEDFNIISQKYSANEISGINRRYYELQEGEPTFLLSYAEQCFIISEGILREWTGGDAAKYYNDGVRAAMSFTAGNTPESPDFSHGRRITPEIIENYLQLPGVKYTGTTEEKLNLIYLQRYFIGFMQDGWNTYNEYRRTGQPVLPVNPLTNLNTLTDRIPMRWMYPSKELSYNREQVEIAINRQFDGNDDVNELMWIFK
jgi:hypothetical protein